jgi:dihydrofolate reductase
VPGDEGPPPYEVLAALVDELHLFVFPLAQGAGKRLFAEGGPAIKLALTGSQAYSNGALHLSYRPAA